MIKAIIIDDELNAIEMLEWLIANYCPDLNIVAKCQSALEGLQALKKEKPDMVFLDIEMPVMNGFDMLEKVENMDFEVVFTTAYDQFAVKAFRFAALNYLLKPIDPDDLQATIKRFQEKKSIIGKEQFNLLLENLKSGKSRTERIALSSGDGLIFVKTDDITYCKADSNYTQVVLADKRRITVAKTLKDLDDTLAGGDFARVHNSYLININHIQKFVRGDGGYIVMPDGEQITISRGKRDEFFQLFSRF